MSTLPLVSCIMPTANRERFIPHAIRYFLRQDYPNKELILLDDGIRPLTHLVPEGKGIRYIRPPRRMPTIGFKRNFACRLSRGEIIMHLDDDDWYAANWISYQADVLLSTGADICGLRELFFYAPSLGKSWKYVYPPDQQPWVAGATMAYKKEFWRKHPFENMQVGEDNHFVWYTGGKVFCHNYLNGFVSIVHPRNTSPKHITDVRWEPADVSGIQNILLDDFRIYAP